MKPFDLSTAARSIKDIYPKSDEFLKTVKNITEFEKMEIIRLWITEGIPYAFKECPMLYEAIRDWFSVRIRIHPKEITLIGSARIGFSLRSQGKYGKKFNKKSDLDFSVISEPWFVKVVKDFELWKEEYSNGSIKPRNKSECKFWPENIKRLPSNINSGFIDPYKIPTFERYKYVCKIQNSLWGVQKKLKITPKAPVATKTSLRVYCDWSAFCGQLKINLDHMIQSTIAT